MVDIINSDTDKMSVYIVRGFMCVCAAILVGLLFWIGTNVADIPVIKAEITVLNGQLTSQGAENAKRLDDHETRIRKLETEIPRGRK